MRRVDTGVKYRDFCGAEDRDHAIRLVPRDLRQCPLLCIQGIVRRSRLRYAMRGFRPLDGRVLLVAGEDRLLRDSRHA